MKPKDSPLNAAVKLLSIRAMSRRELHDALLRREYSPDEADAAVETCVERGFIDEAAYARMLVRRYSEKGYGKRALFPRLRTHGLDSDLISEALDELTVSDDQLDTLLQKRLRGDFSENALNRAAAFLCRRGYAYSDIRRAMERFSIDCPGDSADFECEEDYNGSPSDSDGFPDGAYDD